MLVGVLFALPALRARGINLAVVTLSLGVAVSATVFTNADLTGGLEGTPVGAQSLFGIDLDSVLYPRRWALLIFALFVVCALAIANVRRGSSGRRMIAVRTNERAASALGINVLHVKLYAFALAAGVAGVGGILLGFRNPTVLYTEYDPFQSVLAVGYAFIGGVGFIMGSAVGATLAAGGFGGWLLDTLFPGTRARVAGHARRPVRGRPRAAAPRRHRQRPGPALPAPREPARQARPAPRRPLPEGREAAGPAGHARGLRTRWSASAAWRPSTAPP